jgi:hypothetical protein
VKNKYVRTYIDFAEDAKTQEHFDFITSFIKKINTRKQISGKGNQRYEEPERILWVRFIKELSHNSKLFDIYCQSAVRCYCKAFDYNTVLELFCEKIILIIFNNLTSYSYKEEAKPIQFFTNRGKIFFYDSRYK